MREPNDEFTPEVVKELMKRAHEMKFNEALELNYKPQTKGKIRNNKNTHLTPKKKKRK